MWACSKASFAITLKRKGEQCEIVGGEVGNQCGKDGKQ